MVKKSKGNAYYDPYPNATVIGASSVVMYRQPEAAPLLPGRRGRKRMISSCSPRVGGWCLLALAFSLLVYKTCVHLINCPPDTATRDAIRRDWRGETRQHDILEREWNLKSQEQAQRQEGWVRDTERHGKEVAQRIHDERARQARVQDEWTREIERHAREFEKMRAREREERERERQDWQREVEERDRREEEERLKLNMFWGHIEAHTCTKYATREYTAQLMNLPSTWKNRVEACRATPLEIHGISHLPKSCEDKGSGVVIGRWEISEREPYCTTFWDSYDNKGCTSPGSGKRYITLKLMNLPEKSNWQEFCATTPAQFDDMQFPSAQECFTTILGVYGQWEIDDNRCF